MGGPAGAGDAALEPPAAAEALAFAARSSQSREELEQTLARLKSLGLETGTGDVFRALAQTVPGWVVPAGDAAGGVPAYEAGAIGAMRRIITGADDPLEASRRYHELVRAGVDRFNESSLPAAVQMLELAERLVSERKVDAGSAEIARRKLGDSLDWEKLKKFAEQTSDQAQLRKVLQFFTGLQVEGLMETLPGEPKRDRRRLMLLLLEVHGAPARQEAFERLTRSLGPQVGEEEWFFRRNLLYLLRRIPRGADAPPIDAEIDVVLQHCQLGLPLLVIKEAAAALGQLKDEKTEVGLAQMMNDIEAMLVKPPEKAIYEAKDLRALARPGRVDARAVALAAGAPHAHRARRQEAGAARRHHGAALGAVLAEPRGRRRDHGSAARDGQGQPAVQGSRVDAPPERPEPGAPGRGALGHADTDGASGVGGRRRAVSGQGGGPGGIAGDGRVGQAGGPRGRTARGRGHGRRAGIRRAGPEPPGGPRGLRPARSAAESRRLLGLGHVDAARAEGRARVLDADAARREARRDPAREALGRGRVLPAPRAPDARPVRLRQGRSAGGRGSETPRHPAAHARSDAALRRAAGGFGPGAGHRVSRVHRAGAHAEPGGEGRQPPAGTLGAGEPGRHARGLRGRRRRRLLPHPPRARPLGRAGIAEGPRHRRSRSPTGEPTGSRSRRSDCPG